ncbi:hypothetical protein JCM9534A_17590 [Catenuloplanes indicus JCM 9534]|uniref:Recombinase zinc beta ribbon domain-containing protein n=2 Tax=Catenuloplanes indicus TaxID=137267 RepID=A0AAE4AWV4_9ACTN|nr:hypothetical protein [Catenuloplanes indicus]
MRWNDPNVWLRSTTPSHPAIVTPETYQLAQDVFAAGGRGKRKMPRTTPRPYQLRGLIYCGLCERRMQGNFNHGLPHYRCRFPNEYALANHVEHPLTVYLRENPVAGARPCLKTEVFRYAATNLLICGPPAISCGDANSTRFNEPHGGMRAADARAVPTSSSAANAAFGVAGVCGP